MSPVDDNNLYKIHRGCYRRQETRICVRPERVGITVSFNLVSMYWFNPVVELGTDGHGAVKCYTYATHTMGDVHVGHSEFRGVGLGSDS